MSTPTPVGTGLIPNQWYNVTYQCGTETCPQYHIVGTLNPSWSNGGDITNAVWCGRCRSYCEILSATYLDPQPDPM